MKGHTFLFALAILSALSAPVHALTAQTPDGRPLRQRGGPGSGDPVGLLLDQRETLGLSSSQVTRIESIRAALEQRNAPLLAEIGDAGGPRGAIRGGPGGFGRGAPADSARAGLRDRGAPLAPVLAQVRENNQAAMQEALTVLTPAQREQAASLINPRGGPDGRGPLGPGGPRAPGARPPRPQDSSI